MNLYVLSQISLGSKLQKNKTLADEPNFDRHKNNLGDNFLINKNECLSKDAIN
jgi:hypothetical protein